MSGIVNFTNSDFNNGINELTKNYNKPVMIMFSSKDYDESYFEFLQLAKESNNEFVVARINCEKYNYTGQNLKLSKKVSTPVKYPKFIIYRQNKFNKEYTGKHVVSEFKLAVTEPKLHLSDKIEKIFPIRNHQIYDMYLKARSCFWIEKEIDMSNDKYDWDNKLNDDERFFLSNILAFFAQSDQIVNINLEERFMADVNNLPSDLKIYTKLFYDFQKSMENIHSITYEMILNTNITDSKKLRTFTNAIEHVPAIRKKALWAQKWIDDKNSTFGIRLIAFAILEGVFFCGSFCAIFWIREKNILQGITKANEFINRDESMHFQFAILLFNILKERNDYDLNCSNETIIQIVKEAVEIEQEFITSSFNCRLIGMNDILMKQYIQYVADILVESLNIDKIYNVSNPCQFMENIGLISKTSFFEQRVTEYCLSNSKSDSSSVTTSLSMDDDF